MSNLNNNFNSKKPGILNVSTNQVPLSTGFPLNGSAVFVEDGNGVKSGLKLGVEIVESIEPTTKNGVCNVSFCDRTYAAISDVKLLSSALEIYRQEITENLTDALTPVTTRLNETDISINENSSRLASLDQFVISLQELSVPARLSSIEAEAINKNGSTMVGILSFSSTGSINMGDRPITNLTAPVKPDDAVRKSYVDDEVTLLKADIANLQSQIDALLTLPTP